jgi:pimeloyl-ACP methyl ester carboxylesterase
MTTRRHLRTRQAGTGVHTDEVLKTQNQMLDPLPVRRRFVETRGGHRVHVVEAGEGPPAVFLHGANTSSVSFANLLGLLDGVRVAAVDRPGNGLSDPAPVPRARFREAAVEFVDDVLDALEIDTASLVGQSGGGIWSLWYAMARPERVRSIALLGSAPLLPETRCPAPLRVMAMPGLGPLLARVVRPTPRSFVRLMSSVGEGDTIRRYPDLINAQVAAASDPVASTAGLAELRAVIQPFGYRRSMRLTADELRSIGAPTLIIWGDRDPVGSVDVARAAARLIPNARLEVLPAGHVPQFGHPQRVATMLSNFLGPAGAA